jgi:hypothetical protein
VLLKAVGKVRGFSSLDKNVLGEAVCFVLDKECSLNNVTRLATTVKPTCKGSNYYTDKEHTSTVLHTYECFLFSLNFMDSDRLLSLLSPLYLTLYVGLHAGQ